MAPIQNSISIYLTSELPQNPIFTVPPQIAIVTDALLPVVGAVPVGGGLVTVLVWFNGTAWHIAAL